MPLLPSGTIMQLSFAGRCFGQRILHVRNYALFESINNDLLASAYSNAFINAVKATGPEDKVTPYLACITGNYTLEEIRAQIVDPVRYAYSFLTAPAGSIGTRDAANTANVNAMVEANSAFAGRSEVACYKIGPIALDDSNQGLLTADLLTKLEEFADDLLLTVSLTGVTASDWNPCIWHRPDPETERPSSYSLIVDASPYKETRVKVTRTVRRGE